MHFQPYTPQNHHKHCLFDYSDYSDYTDHTCDYTAYTDYASCISMISIISITHIISILRPFSLLPTNIMSALYYNPPLHLRQPFQCPNIHIQHHPAIHGAIFTVSDHLPRNRSKKIRRIELL